MAAIPPPLLAVILALVDLATAGSLAALYQHRHDAHVAFRGWNTLLCRSALVLIWIHLALIADLLADDDAALCPLFAASLLFYFAYLAAVSVQCWHTYVCWSSLAILLGAGDTRLTLLKPPTFLRYRRLLTSPLFQHAMGVVLMIAFGASSFTSAAATAFTPIARPDRVSARDRCSDGADAVVTAAIFGAAALALAYLSRRLHSVDDRFGLSLEVGGIAASLAVVAVLLGLEPVGDAAAPVQLAEALVIVSINLIWSLGVPLYIARLKALSGQSAKAVRQQQRRPPSSSAATPRRLPQGTLADVLCDDGEARALFKKFCISEFSFENILWLEASDRFKARYATATSGGSVRGEQAGQPGGADTDGFDGFVDELDNLIRGFIRSDGVLTLNLSSAITSSVLEFAQRLDRAATDPEAVRDAIRHGLQLVQKVDFAVIELMKDTFSRFRRSPQYMAFALQMPPAVVELDMSQAMSTSPSQL